MDVQAAIKALNTRLDKIEAARVDDLQDAIAKLNHRLLNAETDIHLLDKRTLSLEGVFDGGHMAPVYGESSSQGRMPTAHTSGYYSHLHTFPSIYSRNSSYSPPNATGPGHNGNAPFGNQGAGNHQKPGIAARGGGGLEAANMRLLMPVISATVEPYQTGFQHLAAKAALQKRKAETEIDNEEGAEEPHRMRAQNLRFWREMSVPVNSHIEPSEENLRKLEDLNKKFQHPHENVPQMLEDIKKKSKLARDQDALNAQREKAQEENDATPFSVMGAHHRVLLAESEIKRQRREDPEQPRRKREAPRPSEVYSEPNDAAWNHDFFAFSKENDARSTDAEIERRHLELCKRRDILHDLSLGDLPENDSDMEEYLWLCHYRDRREDLLLAGALKFDDGHLTWANDSDSDSVSLTRANPGPYDSKYTWVSENGSVAPKPRGQPNQDFSYYGKVSDNGSVHVRNDTNPVIADAELDDDRSITIDAESTRYNTFRVTESERIQRRPDGRPC
ncbi:hypothetical protein B0T26DRAFT_752988 [Lasiosphaeria miniovina]|uniref:Uncharacterized protein n=1 Tax=Lasiosphaeria miniovina TaxID=1954250 RepID=A0AA40ABI3_9PEZI|nr:uncharacterized protein B0T26DRAFT_752988 [Lasiosphaeria miniovina]KAK0712796.1 hypothetical protein B0T26DRAFT_752988 [Lasiosphaeria miniovina]